MLYLKGCPKCHGDMYLEKDSYGVFRQCLQCGMIQEAPAAAKVVATGLHAGKAAVAAGLRTGKSAVA